MTEPLVRAVNVEKRYGATHVLKGVSLDVAAGEVLCIIGPSGSGKSTFLRCINQLEPIDGGMIWVGDEPVGFRQRGNALHELGPVEAAKRRSSIGMVFQHFNLFKHMTVLENLTLAPKIVLGEKASDYLPRARALLAQVGLADREAAYPAQLSGGQQQRVAIARALCVRPRLMLFDEPTSSLDPELVGDVLTVMRELASTGMTMIVVTHEIGFARDVADRVAYFHDGQVAEIGPAHELINAPQHERTRSFLASVR